MSENVGKAVLLIVVWGLALAEPTPIGEAIAVPFTLGVLGMEGSD